MCRSLEEFSDIEKILIISQKHNIFFLNKGSKSFHTVWTYGHDPAFLKAVQQKKKDETNYEIITKQASWKYLCHIFNQPRRNIRDKDKTPKEKIFTIV